jgi:hypothetical protein
MSLAQSLVVILAELVILFGVAVAVVVDFDQIPDSTAANQGAQEDLGVDELLLGVPV